jgi:acyl-ACP thioesterase
MATEVLTREYEVNSFLVNPQKKLGLYSLVSILQDSAWTHATQLGYGYEDSLEKKMFWVLTRQKIVMSIWPAWAEHIQVNTWVRPVRGVVGTRDFEILVDGKKIGESTTSWILLNLETRKPIRSGVASFDSSVRTEGVLELEARKIEVRDDLIVRAEFRVRNSDLDMHYHVNNSRYVQWILDSIPIEWHERHELHTYEINFIAETTKSDTVIISMTPEKDGPFKNDWVQFQGVRKSDGKTVFAARLQFSSI